MECMSRTGNLSSVSLWSHQARPRTRPPAAVPQPRDSHQWKIFHCVSISNGGQGAEWQRGAKRSLPVELIGYSENNVPLAEILGGPNARAVCEFFFFVRCLQTGALGGAGRVRALAHSLKAEKKIIRGSEPNSANPQPN